MLAILLLLVMKFLFSLLLIGLSSYCNALFIYPQGRSDTFRIKNPRTTPARPKYLKKIEKYLGHFANPDFEKKICSIESIFIKNIANKTSFSYFVRFIGKKYCKNGQIKQVAFLVYAKDSLRFLIKNRNIFHFSIKKDQRSIFGKNIALKMLQKSSV